MQHNGTQQMPTLLLVPPLLVLEPKLNLIPISQLLRTPRDIAGIISLPYPCNAPFIVWSNIVNNIVNELICRIAAPELAFGNNRFSICSEYIHIPTVHGNAINIETNKEKVVFSFIVFLSFFALAAEIVGTRAVENATFIAKGKLVNVSTFPPKIPY